MVTMRLYATIYPKPCHVRTTGYEDMLTSYAMMLRKLELEKEKSGELDAYCVHEQKLLLMAVTYRLCSIFSASFKAAKGVDCLIYRACCPVGCRLVANFVAGKMEMWIR